ncbi:MAG: hypothetical protein HYZ37_06165 [Candidatus Solibacter usitatus]|nr:hypothetical protein [Candidatus Solibacter usitatus]
MPVLLMALCAFALTAQERQTAADWPLHAKVAKGDFGVEYMVHSALTGGRGRVHQT